MKLINTKTIGKILNVILIIGFILYIPCFIVSPFLLENNYNSVYSCFLIYPNGSLMLVVIYQFIKLFKSLKNDNPFNYNNVDILLKTSYITFVMSIIWIIDLIVMTFIIHNTYINYIIALLFMFILFLGVSISLYILAILFKKATEYKEENDLMI